jgi:DNA-binding response OmpR family regulator
VSDDDGVVSRSILVVEDDHGLRDVLARGLRGEDFDVVTASDGSGALRALNNDIAAVVLDIGLPDADGRDVCQAMRARGLIAPVIFLTARHQVDDRLSGFASGGDDYLTKPFAFPELVARLRAALRRSSAPVSSAVLELQVDPITHALRLGERGVTVTPIEFRLLARLVASPDTVLRRRQLMEVGWPVGAIVAPNTLDQYIRKVRQRLVSVGSAHEVQVVRGIGYRLASPQHGPPPVRQG